MKNKSILLSAILWFLFSLYSYGAFLDPGWVARPVGMGGAFTALSNDSSGVFWNPAGIAQVTEIEAMFMYAKPFLNLELHAGHNKTNLGMNCAIFLYPLEKWGSFAIGMTELSASGIYKENTYVLSYALNAARIKELYDKIKPKSTFGTIWERRRRRPALQHEIYLGINIKYLQHQYTLDRYTRDDPVFAYGNSKGALSMDFGLIAVFNKKLSVGLMLKNFNSPDVGLKDRDIVPIETRLGAALVLNNLTTSLDISFRSQLFNIYAGGEYLLNPITFRTGANLDEFTAGIGFTIKLLQLDYGFIWPFYLKDSYGTHRISLTIQL